MIDHYNLEDWLMEAEVPFSTSPPDPNISAPGLDNYSDEGEVPQQGSQPDMNMNVGQDQQEDNMDDDPKHPDMPEEKKGISSFENWKKEYFKESIKGNTLKLIELIHHLE